jgi:hypothetical protein
MSTERDKIIDKAKKLKELADRGVDGEKETAQRMYDSYKQKHNLTDEDVDGHDYTEEFIREISNMSDDELANFLANSLINIGLGLITATIIGSSKTDMFGYAIRNTFEEMKKKKNK